MTSAAKAETAGVFGNGQEIIAIRILLKALGHPHLATPLKTDNSMSNSFVHANIKQRHLGHAMELALRQSNPPTTAYVLGQRNRQQCRLFYETPSTVASPYYASKICFKRTSGNYHSKTYGGWVSVSYVGPKLGGARFEIQEAV